MQNNAPNFTSQVRTLICVNGNLLPPSLALAALEKPKKFEVLQVSKFNAFIVDTGSGQHLVGRRQTDERKLTRVDPDKALRLRTANGITTSVWQTRIFIKQLGISIVAWVLEDTPLVLSASKLINEHGFDLSWKASRATLTKDGKKHDLDIKSGVPLISINK